MGASFREPGRCLFRRGFGFFDVGCGEERGRGRGLLLPRAIDRVGCGGGDGRSLRDGVKLSAVKYMKYLRRGRGEASDARRLQNGVFFF